jgi:hypothetical protein
MWLAAACAELTMTGVDCSAIPGPADLTAGQCGRTTGAGARRVAASSSFGIRA